MVLTLLLCLQALGRFLWEVNTCVGSAVRGTGWPVSRVLV